jgi:glycosyltransferase involved in cell wall biosynthesis
MYPHRLHFAFKVPTPRSAKTVWGDLTIAQGLAAVLEKQGHSCRIDFREDWYQGDSETDVVLHVRGLFPYTPQPHHINLMWLISHPTRIREYELTGCDAFLVVSKPFAEKLRPKVEVPVIPFFQQTDPRLFYPGEEKPKYDVIFIGNNTHRGRKIRKIIEDLRQTHHRCLIWGGMWRGIVPDDWIVSDYISKEDSAKVYRQARIILGDHHDDMREEGFICERNYDALASGALLISDAVLGMEEVIDIPVYRTPADLERLLDHYLNNEEERQALVARLRQQVLEEFTFEKRAEQLLELLKELVPATLRRRRNPPPAPMVSIIAATYNRRDLLPRALKSAINQTFRDWEMILVNDGGEEVGDLVRQTGDSRIRYVATEHVGKGHALNTGLRLARGRYIAYLDDDDYYHPDHLERLVKALRESPGAGMVYTDYEEVEERITSEGINELARKTVSLSRISPVFCFNVPHMACLHYRSLLEDVGGYDENLRIYIDWDMLQRLTLASHPRHLPGASMVHTLRRTAGKVASDHIHALRVSDPEYQLDTWLTLLDRASVRMQADPRFRLLQHDVACLRERIHLLSHYLALASQPRRMRPFLEFARGIFRHTYLCGVRDGLAAARGERIGGLEEMPETSEGLVWLDTIEVLRREIERLQAVSDEQWQALQRIRSSLPYRVFRRIKSLAARLMGKSSG